MHTRLCLYLLRNRQRRQYPKEGYTPPQPLFTFQKKGRRSEKGQVLVIFAVVALVLLFFTGLALDAGSVYVTHAQLKRAVDAAAVSAANAFKRNDPSETLPERMQRMQKAAEEVLRLQNVDMSTVDMRVYICDADGDGYRDVSLQSLVPLFYNRCPNTNPFDPDAPQSRKLVWVEAKQQAPLYFLHLLGFSSITLQTDAIAEAAPLNVVLVFDTSESMANETPGFVIGDFDPSTCNAANSCEPMRKAKDAAKALLSTLYQGYDQVGVVTYDNRAVTRLNLTYNLFPSQGSPNAENVIDSIYVHDDAPIVRMWSNWWGIHDAFNPVNPEDRDGDTLDTDSMPYTCPNFVADPVCHDPPQPGDDPMCDRWWSVAEGAPDIYGWGGVPCDSGTMFDAYDWDGNRMYSSADDAAARAWLQSYGVDPSSAEAGYALSPLSTCGGCGIREASNLLRSEGRSGAVWVIIFLSDGTVNLSDSRATNSQIPVSYANGFCSGGMGSQFWRDYCIDYSFLPRYCIDSSSATCPPNTTWEDPATTPYNSLHYSTMDYARDMVDQAALTKSLNPNEPAGNDIAIYVIGLGDAGDVIGTEPIGELFLRYMAAVGDDGDRTTDPCHGVANKRKCGNYYYAPTGNQLLPIFEDIASRIYTRIRE
ncbi:MAG: VWA domain-containing protein [Anaerolineae bacterium]|nr:VWA domain-containing protein [Anaerolineae bacterium]